MKTISLILLISMIFYCCTSTHMIHRDQSNFDELSKELEGKEFSLTLINGEVHIGNDITVDKHTASWIEYSNKYIAPTLEVKKITVMSSFLGMKRGMVYGFLIGASSGAIFGIMVISEMKASSEYYENREALLGTFVALGGIAGAIIGLPLGLLSPGEIEYIFTDSTTRR